MLTNNASENEESHTQLVERGALHLGDKFYLVALRSLNRILYVWEGVLGRRFMREGKLDRRLKGEVNIVECVCSEAMTK